MIPVPQKAKTVSQKLSKGKCPTASRWQRWQLKSSTVKIALPFQPCLYCYSTCIN